MKVAEIGKVKQGQIQLEHCSRGVRGTNIACRSGGYCYDIMFDRKKQKMDGGQSEMHEKHRVMNKEKIIKDDGRYLIFYSFTPERNDEKNGGEEKHRCRS
ncbi:MAG: hypothetical protein GX364_07635 [Firmicutes bacterium]|jgi:hypothetical protein|nr:hypothetical protein [Bacillota bacterium]